jgi:hypothetical protein
MGRVPSSEGGDVKSVAKVNSVTVEKAPVKDIGRLVLECGGIFMKY